MTGSKPKVPSAASELKKTRAAEAKAKKRKHKDASDDAPSKKKLKTKETKSSKKERVAAPQPLFVEPISIAPLLPQTKSVELYSTSLLPQRLTKKSKFQLLTPPQLKTLIVKTRLKMMKSFLNSSIKWYHRLFLRTANSSVLVVP